MVLATASTDDILGAADAQVPAMTSGVLRNLKSVRASVSHDEIADALAAGGLSALDDLWDWRQTAVLKDEALDEVEEIILVTMVLAAAAEGGLDPSSLRVRLQARRLAGNMISGVSRASQRAIQRMAAQLATERVTRVELIDLIRKSVGLTEPSANALLSYRRGLIALSEGRTSAAVVLRRWTLSSEALDGVLTPRRMESLIGKYSDRLLESRAAAIAETEAVRAANAGMLEAWRQQEALGNLGMGVRKIWRTANDERVCPVCGPLDGTPLALSENFRGDGEFVALAMDHPPAHTRCRCFISLETR